MSLTKKQKIERAYKIYNILKNIYPEPKTELNYTEGYELLFAVIMSAQSTDKQVNKITDKLFVKYKTLQDYVDANPEEFEKDINSINFFRNKAKNILKTAKILQDTYDGNVPKTIKEIQALPGAGRKTANVVLGQLHGINEGIAVDTHVARMSNLFGFSRHKDVVKIEKDLMSLFKKEDWDGLHHRLIFYGRYQATARKITHLPEIADFLINEKSNAKIKKPKRAIKKPLTKESAKGLS